MNQRFSAVCVGERPLGKVGSSEEQWTRNNRISVRSLLDGSWRSFRRRDPEEGPEEPGGSTELSPELWLCKAESEQHGVWVEFYSELSMEIRVGVLDHP